MIPRLLLIKIILTSLCGILLSSDLGFASASSSVPEKVIWTAREKEIIKKGFNLFGALVTSEKEDVYVFQSPNENSGLGPISTYFGSISPAPFSMTKIPKGTKILDLTKIDHLDNYAAFYQRGFRDLVDAAKCSYSQGLLPSAKKVFGYFIEPYGRCEVILNKILSLLNVSAIKTASGDQIQTTRQCHINLAYYSVLDQSLTLQSVLINPKEIAPSGNGFIERLKTLYSIEHLRYGNKLLSPDAIETVKWAEENHFANCIEKKDIDLFKQMPNLVKQVVASTFVLPRDTLGFHWQDQEAILWDRKMPKDSLDYQVQEYIRYSTSRFWADPNDGGSAGNGLYLAIDPESTSTYGVSLLEVTLRKGTRYFVYEGYPYSKIDGEALAEIKAEGCNVQDLKSLYYKDDASCENIARALTKELKISFVVFYYTGKLPKTCNKLGGQAFLVFDPSAIVSEKTFIFPGEGKIDTPDSSKKRELGMLANFHFYYSLTNSSFTNFTSRFYISGFGFNNWVHEGFYGCDYDPFTIHEIK